MFDFKQAVKIDFTQKMPSFKYFDGFNDNVKDFIRSQNNKNIIIADYAVLPDDIKISCVSDHINVSGSNPLVGPNHPIGERFPVMNNIYHIDDLALGLKSIIVCGVKSGFMPSSDEFSLIQSWQAGCVSYNLVPAAIVAAHAGFKIFGLILAKNCDEACLKDLNSKWS